MSVVAHAIALFFQPWCVPVSPACRLELHIVRRFNDRVNLYLDEEEDCAKDHCTSFHTHMFLWHILSVSLLAAKHPPIGRGDQHESLVSSAED